MQNLDKKNLTLLLGVVLVVLAGLYAWLWALFRDMVQNLACIVDGITEGKDMGGNVTAAMEELPPSTVKALQDSRPVFLTLTALPNAITWITLVLYVSSGKCACFGGPDSQARKILYYFTIFIMLLGMGFLLGVGIQGSRFATGSIPEVDLICSDYLDATRVCGNLERLGSHSLHPDTARMCTVARTRLSLLALPLAPAPRPCRRRLPPPLLSCSSCSTNRALSPLADHLV